MAFGFCFLAAIRAVRKCLVTQPDPDSARGRRRRQLHPKRVLPGRVRPVCGLQICPSEPGVPGRSQRQQPLRKLGVPGQEELALGAIASGGARVLNQDVLRALGISRGVVDLVAEREQRELLRREREYRDGRAPVDIRNRTVILVDDGLATGSSMRVAAIALKQKDPAKIIAAGPVGAPETWAEFESAADKGVCAAAPEPVRT